MPARTLALRSRPCLEELEPREVLSGYSPTVAEQVFLERLNDARANPAAYGSSIGVDLSDVSPSQPLAFDTRLIEAARDHSQDMNDRAFFDHVNPDGWGPGSRISAAGYSWNSYAESIAAGTNLNPESALKLLIIDAGVPSLGHRKHLLAMTSSSAGHKEVGIGIYNGNGPYKNYFTIDTASNSDTRPFLTGVAYNDVNSNGKYDAGEGLGGLTLTVAGVGSITTWSTGGYSYRLNAGTYTVTISGSGLAQSITKTVTVGSSNYRLNFIPGENQAPIVAAIANQTMPASQDKLVLTLSASDPDGDPVTFSASAQNQAYLLDQQLGLYTTGDLFVNWGGKNEKWMQGNGAVWYFILPSGELYQWDNSSQATGTLVATLAASYHTSPATLYSATPGLSGVTVSVAGNQLTIDPASGYTGTFGVTVTGNDGKGGTHSRTFSVTVAGSVNLPPVLTQPPNQVMSTTQNALSVTLAASDPEGSAVTFSATVESQAYQLDQQRGFYSDGNLWLNWGGQNEKWFQGTGGVWYFILPSGALYTWSSGSLANGTFVAQLESYYYTNISALFNATVGATVAVSGNQLTVDPNAGFIGKLFVKVTASDGSLTDSKTFTVTVA